MRRGRIPYSEAEMDWLAANHAMVLGDYHRGFCAQFGRDDVRIEHLNALRKRNGWKVGRDGRRYRGRHRRFDAAEIAWLSENRTLPIGAYHAAFQAAFGREDVTPQNLHALRKRQGWHTGRTGHFEKGQVSHNKGKRCAPGTGGRHPNAARTQFKAGQVPHTYRGPGHERIDSKDGYIVIIVAAPNPWTGAATRPVHKHRWLWEQKHGPLPKGHVLKCLDGDKTNTDPGNWEAVPRSVMARLNGGPQKSFLAYDAAPAELKPTVLAAAKLDHRAREIRRSKAAAE